MVESDNLRFTRIALNNGSGAIPALGFGTLIPDPIATRTATRAALEAGFRVIDTAERYRTESEVGEALQEMFEGGKIKREDVFVITKLWNTNHRPNASNPPARPVSRNSNSNLSISISSTPPSLSSPETTKIREMPTAR